MSDEIRVPPHSDEAERSLLGAVLLDNEVMDRVLTKIDPEDFYRERHRHIFRAMNEIFESTEEDNSIDVITLGDYLSAEEQLESVGGASFLTRLSNEVPSAANVENYIRLVRKKSMLRQFISSAGSLVEESYSDVADVDGFMDRAEREIFAITQTGISRDYAKISEVLEDAFEQLEALYETTEQITGVPSGFIDLDDITAGWQDSDLIIVAARPAMGKTSLTLNMLAHAAMERNVPAVFFSLEMANTQLATRMLCTEARVNQRKVRKGTVTEREWSKLIKAAGRLNQAKLYLDDTPAISIMEMRSKCRRLKAEHDIGIVFIDYLQLMTGGGGHDIREQEISEISRGLKGIAKELDIPVVALAQLNRGVESRTDKRPKMRDLRESGAIEQDADLITFIYRDEVYNEDSEDKGIAEIIIGKNRHGPIDTVRLRFFPEYTRFESFAPDREDYPS